MSFVLDLIILAIIVICIAVSAHKGFVKTIVGFVGMVLAIVLALSLSAPLANITYEKAVEPAVTSSISGVIGDIENKAEGLVKEEVYENLPDFVKNNIDISELEISAGEDTAAAITESAIKPIAISFLKTIFSLILFVILIIAVKFLTKILNSIFSFSILGKANKILGGVLGLVQGLIVALIFILISNLLISLTGGFLIFTQKSVDESYLFSLVSKILPSSFLF